MARYDLNALEKRRSETVERLEQIPDKPSAPASSSASSVSFSRRSSASSPSPTASPKTRPTAGADFLQQTKPQTSEPAAAPAKVEPSTLTGGGQDEEQARQLDTWLSDGYRLSREEKADARRLIGENGHVGAGKERPAARRPAAGIQPPDAARQQDQPHCKRDDRRGGGLWDSGAGGPYERRQHRGRRGAGCPDPEPHRDFWRPDRRQPGRLRAGGSRGGTDPRFATGRHGTGRDPGRKGAAQIPVLGRPSAQRASPPCWRDRRRIW